MNKIVGYESTPYVADRDWYKRACLVGDPSSSGYSTIQLQQWIKTRLRQLGYAEIDTIFADPFTEQMATALNKGDTIFSYRGWYQMSGWTNTNTYTLTNGWKLPFVIAITCGTGSFAGESSCGSEGFLRANSGAANPKGGIAAIGTATTGTHTRFNNCIHFGVCQGLLYEQQRTLGAALTRGKLEMYLNYQKTEPNKVTIWSYWNNLMGDPAVDCWTGFPQAISVSAPSSLPIGANSVAVTVTKSGAPEPDVQVCLWKGAETYAVGRHERRRAGRASRLDADRRQHAPDRHQAQSGPLPGDDSGRGRRRTTSATSRSQSMTTASGGSSGNGDGQVEPGRDDRAARPAQELRFRTAASVTATLTSADPYVTIVDGAESFGTIAAGATAWSDASFVLGDRGRLSGWPCDPPGTRRDGIDRVVALPDRSAGRLRGVLLRGHDGLQRRQNGLLDPGETVELSVVLRNTGHAVASGVTGTLTSLSPMVIVTDARGVSGRSASARSARTPATASASKPHPTPIPGTSRVSCS